MSKADQILLRQAYIHSHMRIDPDWKTVAKECSGDEAAYVAVWRKYDLLAREKYVGFRDRSYEEMSAITAAADAGLADAAERLLRSFIKRHKKSHKILKEAPISFFDFLRNAFKAHDEAATLAILDRIETAGVVRMPKSTGGKKPGKLGKTTV